MQTLTVKVNYTLQEGGRSYLGSLFSWFQPQQVVPVVSEDSHNNLVSMVSATKRRIRDLLVKLRYQKSVYFQKGMKPTYELG